MSPKLNDNPLRAVSTPPSEKKDPVGVLVARLAEELVPPELINLEPVKIVPDAIVRETPLPNVYFRLGPLRLYRNQHQ
jgi:hypothetical protein